MFCKYKGVLGCPATCEAGCGGEPDQCLLTKYLKAAKDRWYNGEQSIHEPNLFSVHGDAEWFKYLPEYRRDQGVAFENINRIVLGTTVHISPDHLRSFWDMNERNLCDETWLVAENPETSSMLWITSDGGTPVLRVFCHNELVCEHHVDRPDDLYSISSKMVSDFIL